MVFFFLCQIRTPFAWQDLHGASSEASAGAPAYGGVIDPAMVGQSYRFLMSFASPCACEAVAIGAWNLLARESSRTLYLELDPSDRLTFLSISNHGSCRI